MEMEEVSAIKNELKKQSDSHIVLLKCSSEVFRTLKKEGYNIYPNRNKGFRSTYLCDLKHDVQHK